MDVAPVDGFALPIFTPLSGFSSCTAPTMEIETHDISEGNWYFKTKLFKHADVQPLTLTRGATLFNSDFWRWMNATVTGDTSAGFPGIPLSVSLGGPTPRRQLILI